jgi:hypothetical protein
MWSVIGGELVDWAWWRVLLTTLVGCIVIIFVMGIATAAAEVRSWPTTFRERTRHMTGFFAACATLLLATWWLTHHLPFVLATVGLGLVFTLWTWPPASPASKDTKRPTVTDELRQLANELPKEPHPEIKRLVEEALEDWQHLFEVLATEASLEQETEAMALEATASAGIVRLLQAGVRAQRLQTIADERPDDDHAPAAAEAALRVVRDLAAGLHDTTSALLRYVSTRRPDEVAQLRLRVDELSSLAEVEEALSPKTMDSRARS